MKGKKHDSSLRADIYKCFTDGNTVEQAIVITGCKQSYVQNCYTQFAITRGVIYCTRIDQIKHIEAQLFFAIENTTNNQLIQRLQNSYSKFLL